MALITRMSKLFTADVHAVLDRIEEPEIVLKQAIREMAEEVARGEQRLRWLTTEQQSLNQRITSAEETITSLDGELDLCFEADEHTLARSLVKRKLEAEQIHRQATLQLDSNHRACDALEQVLAEQGLQLTDMRQKADVLVDTQTVGESPLPIPGIDKDAIDVAFLREKQRRES